MILDYRALCLHVYASQQIRHFSNSYAEGAMSISNSTTTNYTSPLPIREAPYKISELSVQSIIKNYVR